MAKTTDDILEFLSFHLGQEEYAIEILKVQEIRSYEPVTTLSHSPNFLKGVLNLRGTMVPIIDLRLLFQLPHVEYTPFTVVIILNLNKQTIGIVVDSVSDVLALTKENIKEPPNFGTLINSQYIKGMAPVDEHMLIILDIEKLMLLDDLRTVRDFDPAQLQQ